jgi:hypothetical protein
MPVMSTGARNALALAIMAGVAIWFWDSLLLYPVKIFVVLLHELSHGLAAVATGGQIISIEVTELIGGLCRFQGGNPVFVASAGYLGSLAGGSLILVLAGTGAGRWATAGIALLMLAVAAVWVENTFGIFFTAGFAVLMLAAGRFLPYWALRLCLQFLGTASCLYVLVDIKEDLLRLDQQGSDAEALASLTGLPALFWGAVWGMVALIMTVGTVWLTSRGTGQPGARAKRRTRAKGGSRRKAPEEAEVGG